jgi:uncharacterized protein (DUF983 family)
MSIEIAGAGSTTAMPTTQAERSVPSAVWRGANLRCPSCGRGHLFRAYLKVSDTCLACGEELHHHRADDAPPYFTILIVGHIIVGAALFLEGTFAPSIAVHALLWLPLTLLMSLVLLAPIKGALVGLQWALRMHGFGTGPDPAAPDELPSTSGVPK